jgi:hypothetical protein
VDEFDGRIHAGDTDVTTYRFALPKNWPKRDVRVDTKLWYRRAFKPIADQRKWTLPLNGNPHGTRGDGTDYDGGLVIAERRNLLSCRGRLAKVALRATPSAGTAGVTATFKAPRKTPVDPVADGAHVTLGIVGDAALSLDEALQDLVASGKTITYAGGTTGVRSLTLVQAGKHAYKVALDLAGLPADTLAQRRLAIAFETGDVCAQRTLKCKTRGDAVRCR